jgi:hypothetical protein
MQPSTRYALATLVGLAFGGVAYLAADVAVEPTLAGMVAGLNALVWAGFVAHYVPVYRTLNGAPAATEDGSPWAAAKWGGIAGLAASVGVAGVAVVVLPFAPNWFVAAIGLFTFGLTLWAMAVGMGVVTERFARQGRLDGANGVHSTSSPVDEGGSATADDD